MGSNASVAGGEREEVLLDGVEVGEEGVDGGRDMVDRG